MISIIIPVRNRSVKILDAIISVEKQTYSDWEIIVCDDNSDEDEAKYLKLYAEDKNFKIRLIRVHEHVGQGMARNIAFRYSKGDIIAYLDSDDYWAQSHLSYSINSSYDVSGDFFMYSPCIYEHEKELTKQVIPTIVMNNPLPYLSTTNFIAINSVLHSRNMFIKAGGFEEGVVCGEDGVLWRRMLEAGAKVIPKWEPTSYYVMDNNNKQQHLILEEPKNAKHLFPGGNGQELDNMETLKDRRLKLLGIKDFGVKITVES